MATREVELTKRFDDFIEKGVASGRYASVSAVVKQGLRLLEQKEKEEAAWNQYIAEAAQVGIDAMDRGDYFKFDSRDEFAAFIRQVGDEARARVTKAAKKRA